MANSAANSDELSGLLRQVAAGDQAVWGHLLETNRPRLLRMVELRLDPRLQGRLDASDVIQEAYLTASVQLADYLKNPTIPFYLWLRLVTSQKLVLLHRNHLGTKARDVRRQISLDRGALPAASSVAMASKLVGREPTPSEAVGEVEQRRRLQEALDRMNPLDREVLALRHFEQLTNAETAQVLGLEPSAASKRYVRALERLKGILFAMPGESGETLA
ncbi:MAG TPA: sigma-70 family RNA polymerase sigma factor [Pirellulales bacterium]|jgi:RNA polymerase sigma-70 factor (ECF subfamily)|nr:sigma-70 family RNA polymerase sigma factor [Pirellulales bacterium]